MKSFHFSLESLRILRKQKEQAAQQRYARALTTCEEATLQFHRATTELAGGRQLLSHELGQGVPAGRLSALRAWCQALENRWDTRRSAVDESRRSAGIAFKEMVAAARDRETLDRFHDKSRRNYDRAVQREEQSRLDEMAVQLAGATTLLQLDGHHTKNPS